MGTISKDTRRIAQGGCSYNKFKEPNEDCKTCNGRNSGICFVDIFKIVFRHFYRRVFFYPFFHFILDSLCAFILHLVFSRLTLLRISSTSTMQLITITSAPIRTKITDDYYFCMMKMGQILDCTYTEITPKIVMNVIKYNDFLYFFFL